MFAWKSSRTSLSGAALAAALMAASGVVLAAAPAFRSASSAAKGLSPEFRAASSASAPGITFRAASSAATNTQSLAVSRPSGTAANDVMIASISVRPYTATITAPTGWTLVRRVNYTSLQTSSLAVYRRVATSSEASSYTWSFSGATYGAGGIQSFTGVDTTSPVNVEAGQAVGEGMSFATPSVTTTVANAMLVSAHSFPTSTTWDPPSGMTEGIDVQYQPVGAGVGQSLEANYAIQTVAGATGAKTATANGNAADNADPGTTHILALKPKTPVLSVNLPSGTTTNDVMIAAVSVRPYTATITAPSGWTLVRRVDYTSLQTSSLAVYRKVAGGSEPSSYTWNFGSGTTFAVGGIQSFYNVDTANPIDVEAGQGTPEGMTHATPSVTTTVGNTMLVTAHEFPSSSTWTPPSGMNEGFDIQAPVPGTDGTGQSMEANWTVQGAAGATGAKTATAAGDPTNYSDPGATHILALRPATSASSLSITIPAGTATNDVMIAAVAVRPSSAAIGTPAGWTLVRRVDNTTGQTDSLAVFRKLATSSEAAPSFDVSGATYAAGGIQSFSGVDTTNPIDVENGQATPDGFTHATPSITTSIANTMIVTAHTFGTSSTWTPPSGMTEGFDVQVVPVQQAFGQSMEGDYVTQATAGATGAKSATAAGSGGDSDVGAAHILALRPLVVVAVPQLYYIHADHLNTPRLITDASQQVVWRNDQTEPFDSNPPDENPSGLGLYEFPLRDDGTYFDKETGLLYNWNRYRDNSGGRFLQADPLGVRNRDLSLYVLRRNNPLRYTDPDGLDVSVHCRPVVGTFGRYSHCFVHVTCPQEGIDEVLSLFGKPPYGIGGLPATGYKSSSSSMDGGEMRDDPSSPANNYNKTITPQRPNCNCDYEKNVLQRFHDAPATQPYGGTGSNSNTFAQDLVTSPSFGTNWPSDAPSNAVGTLPMRAGRIQ